VVGRAERFTTAALDGVFLHATHWGNPSAPELVLLHGGGANAHWWDHVAPRLSERFHVVALDFRGHGDSDHPVAVEPGAFQRDLQALLQHLAAPSAVLLGHSMGGHVALSHAAHHGAVMGPRAVVAVEVTRGAARQERRRMRLALAARRSYATREQAIARYRFLPPAPHASEELRRRVAEGSVQEQDGRFSFKFDPRWFTIPPTPRPDLTRVAAPTLVVRGAESTLLSPDGADELAREIPGARLAVIPAAGHNVHIDQPDAFTREVDVFLAAHA
jgi:pimeloyl-ACP methyl ester carboxylesterase